MVEDDGRAYISVLEMRLSLNKAFNLELMHSCHIPLGGPGVKKKSEQILSSMQSHGTIQT